MKVALVSPYSWTYPGGVTRHIEALAVELLASGHDVRVLAPYDSRRAPHRLAAPRIAPAAARGARVADPARPHDRLALERRSLQPGAHAVRDRHDAARAAHGRVRRRPSARAGRAGGRLGRADVDRGADRRHVPLLLRGADRRTASPICSAPAASSTGSPRGSRCPRRPPGPAGASTAARTGSSPTASCCPRAGCPRARTRAPGDPLEIVFVGQAVERKGLPILLRAFEALRAHVPARLTVVGASEPEVEPLLVDREGVTILGRVSDAEKHAALEARRRARRAVAGRRVVRDGPDRELRGRHAGRRLGHRRLPRRRLRRRRRPALPARRRDRARRDAARPRARPRAHHRAGRRRRRQRRPLRLAEGGRPGRGGLRGRARGAEARGREGAAGRPLRPPLRRPRSAPPRPAAPVARAGAGGRRASRGQDRPARRDRRRRARRGRRAPTSRSTTSAWTGSASRS